MATAAGQNRLPGFAPLTPLRSKADCPSTRLALVSGGWVLNGLPYLNTRWLPKSAANRSPPASNASPKGRQRLPAPDPPLLHNAVEKSDWPKTAMGAVF